jgi:hypothetical protein
MVVCAKEVCVSAMPMHPTHTSTSLNPNPQPLNAKSCTSIKANCCTIMSRCPNMVDPYILPYVALSILTYVFRYLHGAVVRKPALLWRNGHYTWDADEAQDLSQCWHCDFTDCEHLELERARVHRQRDWITLKSTGYPPGGSMDQPVVLARLSALTQESLNQRLHVAVGNASTRAVALCVQAGAELEWSDEVGMTALHVAAAIGCEEVCEALLLLGANANARTRSGATPLHFASFRGATPTVEALVRGGAWVDAQDKLNNTGGFGVEGLGFRVCKLNIGFGV